MEEDLALRGRFEKPEGGGDEFMAIKVGSRHQQPHQHHAMICQAAGRLLPSRPNVRLLLVPASVVVVSWSLAVAGRHQAPPLGLR